MVRGGRRILITAAVIIVVIAAAALYTVFDPAESGWFPRCPVLMFTGLKCPGCGSQRMIHALLHGDIAGAFRYNAMLLMMLPLILALVCAEPLRHRCPRFYMALNSNAIIITALILIGVWTIARNLFGW